MIKIIVKARSVYGETKFYPANDAAEIFAKIAGTKTLTLATLGHIKSLGLQLELSAEASLEDMRV